MFDKMSIKSDDFIYDHPKSAERLKTGSTMATSLPSVGGGSDSNYDSEDVYSLLAQKERDLLLAAEIGQALLEKNEELSKQNEKIAEEFSKKLEELEQEKYHLRRRLESAEEEYELRMSEMQADIQKLKLTLTENSLAQRQADKEKSLLIQTLTEQNQRLTTQLKEFSKKEASLTQELQTLRDQMNLKRSSLDEHVSHLNMLREEISLMTERKIDLERRVCALQGEREGLSSTLDESADRIVMLEKQNREQEYMIQSNNRMLDELKATNVSLSDRLDSMNRSLSISPAHNLSLLNEMEMSDSEKSLGASRKPPTLDEDEDDEIECDNPELQTHPNLADFENLQEEVLSSYAQIKTLCSQLRHRSKMRRNSGDSVDTSSSSDVELQHSLKNGLLRGVVQELKGLLHDLMRKEAKGSCLTCGADINEKMKLEIQLHKAIESQEKMEKQVRLQEEDGKRKSEEILELKSRLSETDTMLVASKEEVLMLRDDLANTNLSKDDLIRKAWEVRDAAVKRKNNTEIELARSRIDVMQINSQLLEAIQQKVELSQQLEQWKIDMQELLDEQMARKMKAQEGRKRINEDKSANESDNNSQLGHENRKLSKLLSSFFHLK